MLKHVLPLLLALTLLAFGASFVSAEPAPYSVGFSFDPGGVSSWGYIPGFAAPTRLYFLMFDLGEQIVGFEASVSISGPNSESWIVTRGSVVGLDVDPDPDGYVVGIGVCAGTPGSPYVLNTYDFAYFTAPQGPANTLICAGAPTVSNPSIPGFPSYQTCSGNLEPSALAETDITCPGCALINVDYGSGAPCDVVATAESSWAALKSQFGP